MDTQFDSTYNRLRLLAWLVGVMETTNAKAAEEFALVADGWKNQALRARETGAPAPEKPAPPLAGHAVAGEDGWPTTVWGPDRAADPIPDLPAPAEYPQAAVGDPIPGTNLYRGAYGDASPDGTIAVKNGVKFRCIRNPWGCYWAKA